MAKNKSTPETTATRTKKDKKTRDERRILGLTFTSPAVAFVSLSNVPGTQLLMVDRTTERAQVKGWRRQESRLTRVAIVDGVVNLPKLGKLPDPTLRVVVLDVASRLTPFKKCIRPGDFKEVDGEIKQATITQLDAFRKRVMQSGYGRPLSPKKIRGLGAINREDSPGDLPAEWDPIASLKWIVESCNPSHKETAEWAIFNFMAGLSNRRSFGGARRGVLTNLVPGADVDEVREELLRLQRWMEDDEMGRRVSSAFQIMSKKKLPLPVAAGRVDAHIGMLQRLIRALPPSKRMDFTNGWQYLPGESERIAKKSRSRKGDE